MKKQLDLFPELVSNNQDHLKKTDRLLNIFESIHNHIYANDGLSSQEAFVEMLDILFVKVFDENNNVTPQFNITISEFDILSKGGTSKEFISRFTNLYEKAAEYFKDILEKNRKPKVKSSTLAYIINKLQSVHLSSSSQDIKGLAFQKFLFSKQRSDRGQFFTPEQVVNLCIQVLKPKMGFKILDPACGSGGFLSQAVKYAKKNNAHNEIRYDLKEFVAQNVYGIEINRLAGKVAIMRMLLESDSYSNICIADSLSEWDAINYQINIVADQSSSHEESFDLILTNPPFGSQGKIRDESVLKRFDLAYKGIIKNGKYNRAGSVIKGQVPDILFIERCLDFLKNGGRMAIVLPNGILENRSLEYVRDYIWHRARILGIVKLPHETFVPFGTGVKASVLFLQKLPSKELEALKNDGFEIFFGKINKLGYSCNKNGSIVYKKDKHGENIVNDNEELVIDEDISQVIEAYNKFESGSLNNQLGDNFSVKYSDISSRLDSDFYTPTYKKLETGLRTHGSKNLGDVVKIIKRTIPKKLRNENNSIEYVELSDISSEYLEITNSTTLFFHQLPSRATYLLKEGDIVTAIAGNSIGSRKHMSALVTKRFDGAVSTNGLRILKTKDIIDPFYLLFYLRTELFLDQVLRYRTGAAIPAISDEDLLRILIYLPGTDEQRHIADLMRQSIELREESKRLIAGIDLGISL